MEGLIGERTLIRNIDDLSEIKLHQRVRKEISECKLDDELFGHCQSLPVALAPVGLTGKAQ